MVIIPLQKAGARRPVTAAPPWAYARKSHRPQVGHKASAGAAVGGAAACRYCRPRVLSRVWCIGVRGERTPRRHGAYRVRGNARYPVCISCTFNVHLLSGHSYVLAVARFDCNGNAVHVLVVSVSVLVSDCNGNAVMCWVFLFWCLPQTSKGRVLWGTERLVW